MESSPSYHFGQLRLFGLFFLLILPTSLSSQDRSLQGEALARYVKERATEFISSEVADLDERTAREIAKKNVIEQIVVNVYSESGVNVEQTGGEVKEDFQLTVRTSSRLSLQGLKYIDLGSMPDGRRRFVCYISTIDVDRSFDMIAEQIQSGIQAAELMESNLGLPKAFDQYYLLYLRTYYSPRPIKYSSETLKKDFADAKGFLKLKILLYLNEVSITMKNDLMIESGTERTAAFSIPAELFYRNQPVQKLSCKLDTPDSPAITAVDGKANFLIYGEPNDQKREFRLKIKPSIDARSVAPELLEIAELVNVFDTRRVTLDFSKLQMVDFAATVNENEVEFSPVIKNVNLSGDGILWNFGDGNTSKQFRPKTRYSKPGKYQVTLQLNNNSNFLIKKEIIIAGESEPSPPLFPEPFGKFAEVKQANQLLSLLNDLKSKGLLSFGKQTDFTRDELCYIALIDPKTKEFKGFLLPLNSEKKRVELFSGDSVSDHKEKSRGFQAVWIYVN